MSRRDVCIWTCDRCRRGQEMPTHNDKGERNGEPNGWRHVQTRPSMLDVDLCDRCAASLWGWWSEGFAHVEPAP